MKLYDFALTLVRALVAMFVIRQGGDLVFDVLRMGLDVSTAGHPKLGELTALMGSGFSILFLLIIWAASRPIARFAASYPGAPT